jgi:hypothetical protein
VAQPVAAQQAGPSQPFGPRQSQGRLSPPTASAACRQNLAGWWPVVGGGVAGDGGQKTAVAKSWVRARRWPLLSEGAQRGLDASVRTRLPTGVFRAVFNFSNLSKTGSILKIQNGCFILLQKFPIFAYR